MGRPPAEALRCRERDLQHLPITLVFPSLPFDRSALQYNTTLGVFLLHLFLIPSLGAAALLGCQASAK